MDRKNVFINDVEVPDIVQQKAEAAFSQIRKEKVEKMDKNVVQISEKNKKNKKKIKSNMWRKAVTAVAACAVLATAIGLGDFYPIKNQTVEKETEKITDFAMNTNPFVLTVQAAGLEGEDYRELESGKPIALDINSSDWVLSGSEDGSCSYCINLPLSCEGEGITDITYRINKGAFQVVEKEGSGIISEGKEDVEELNVGQIGGAYDEENSGEELYPVSVKYYSEFTLDYDKQSSETTWINMCNEAMISDMNLIWGEDSTKEDWLKGYQELVEGTFITCMVHFEDGTSHIAKLKAGTVLTTAKEAGFDRPEDADVEEVYFTLERIE